MFFVLSGFVLPISYLKSERNESIMGSVFRRYVRLVWPVLAVNSLMYFAANTFWSNRWNDYQQTGGIDDRSSFLDMFLYSFGYVWFGDDRWNGPEWTMSVELWGSFFVFLAVHTLYGYRYRYAIFIMMMAFFYLGQRSIDNVNPDKITGNQS